MSLLYEIISEYKGEVINMNLYKIARELYNEMQRGDFQLWQNDIAKNVSSTLAKSYKNIDDEVAMVTNLCECINKRSNGRMHLYAQKIHGNRSKVKFVNDQDQNVKCEMADMVVISLVTYQKNIIYEKIALIQNKKESGYKKWTIDQNQLYLLTNFPTFDGVTGIYHNQNSICLPNLMGQLGNYGLFASPCNFIFTNASVVNALQKNRRVAFDDLKQLTTRSELPIFGECRIALNTLQFVRNWTQFNVGELVISNGRMKSRSLTDLTISCIGRMGLGEIFNLYDIGSNNKDIRRDLDYKNLDATVMVMHFDIGET